MTTGKPLARLLEMADILMAAAVIGIIFMLIIPLPPTMLDALLVVNIAASLLAILTALQIQKPLEFAVFPTLLLLATLFRLALDVSATRMILLHGHQLDPVTRLPIGAGHLIPAFGQVVVGGNLLVGCVMFTILIVIQLLVLTNGSERIAQVGARFCLDAMPGRQMAIDSELAAGALTADQAREKRRELEAETDFYGSMDGAGRFVKGDAIASIVIIVVNVVGGVLMGVLYHGLGAGDALRTYAILSIGNGLMTTVPAFLMSTSMGLIVTRAAGHSNLGHQIASEFTSQPRALKMTGQSLLFLSVLALLGLPFPPLPFAVLGGFMLYMARELGHTAEVEEVAVAEVKAEVKKTAERQPANAISLLGVDPLSLEVGRGLLSLVDPEQGARLLERVTSIRRHIVGELGIIVPGVRFRDNLQLKPSQYVIRVKDIEVARGEVQVNQFMAIGPEEKLKPLRGTRTTDPTYGMPAVWISPEQRGDAERQGCMIFDPVSVVATQLTEVIRAHAAELLGRQEVQSLLDAIKKTHPAVIKDVLDTMSLAEVQKILQNVVRERVSIKDLVTVLETISDQFSVTREPEMLTEFARVALARTICRDYANNDQILHVITVDPGLEQLVAGKLPPPDTLQEILHILSDQVRALQERGQQPILLTSPAVRSTLRRLTERSFPNLVVLSWNEIAAPFTVQAVGTALAA